MENLDLAVLRALRDWRRAGHRALLATVVRTWGSSPRPVGSIMGLRDDGAVVGSVSGGCIEDDMIDRFTAADPLTRSRRELPVGAPVFLRYGVTADEAHRFGLPCGGTLELLIEFDPGVDVLHELIAALEAGRLMRRELQLASGIATVAPSNSPEDLSLGEDVMTQTFGPEYRMLLIGAGQLAEYLATMALFNGFSVMVCDPRPEYAAGWSVGGATLVREMPDDVVAAFRPDRRSCVIALTHDPKLDDLAILEALGSQAFYVGTIGSRRNNEARRQRMLEFCGATAQSLARLRGPIGVYIGSKTPPEIAVSVMAEVLAAKNGVTLPVQMDVSHAKNAAEK